MSSLDFNMDLSHGTAISHSGETITRLTALKPEQRKHLAVLTFSRRGLTAVGDLSDFESLEQLYLDHNAITSLAQFPDSIKILSIQYNNIKEIEILELHHLQELKLDWNVIESIEENAFNICGASLKTLTLSHNKLTSLVPLQLCTRLQILDVSDNELSEIEYIEGIEHLMELNVAKNDLEELTGAILLFPRLLKLNASQNSISYVSLGEEHNSLDSLNLSGNDLTSVEGLASFPSLTNVNLDQNSLTGLEDWEDNLSNVRVLSVAGNTLYSDGGYADIDDDMGNDGTAGGFVEIPEMPYLQEVNASDNRLTTLTHFADSPELTSLQLSNNQVQDVQHINDIESLMHLDLNNNMLIDSAIQFKCQLSKLHTLLLCNNGIEDLAGLVYFLEDLKRLRRLDLRGNPLTSFYSDIAVGRARATLGDESIYRNIQEYNEVVGGDDGEEYDRRMQYRLIVLYRLGTHLKLLDHIQVSEEEVDLSQDDNFNTSMLRSDGQKPWPHKNVDEMSTTEMTSQQLKTTEVTVVMGESPPPETLSDSSDDSSSMSAYMSAASTTGSDGGQNEAVKSAEQEALAAIQALSDDLFDSGEKPPSVASSSSSDGEETVEDQISLPPSVHSSGSDDEGFVDAQSQHSIEDILGKPKEEDHEQDNDWMDGQPEMDSSDDSDTTSEMSGYMSNASGSKRISAVKKDDEEKRGPVSPKSVPADFASTRNMWVNMEKGMTKEEKEAHRMSVEFEEGLVAKNVDELEEAMRQQGIEPEIDRLGRVFQVKHGDEHDGQGQEGEEETETGKETTTTTTTTTVVPVVDEDPEVAALAKQMFDVNHGGMMRPGDRMMSFDSEPPSVTSTDSETEEEIGGKSGSDGEVSKPPSVYTDTEDEVVSKPPSVHSDTEDDVASKPPSVHTDTEDEVVSKPPSVHSDTEDEVVSKPPSVKSTSDYDSEQPEIRDGGIESDAPPTVTSTSDYDSPEIRDGAVESDAPPTVTSSSESETILPVKTRHDQHRNTMDEYLAATGNVIDSNNSDHSDDSTEFVDADSMDHLIIGNDLGRNSKSLLDDTMAVADLAVLDGTASDLVDRHNTSGLFAPEKYQQRDGMPNENSNGSNDSVMANMDSINKINRSMQTSPVNLIELMNLRNASKFGILSDEATARLQFLMEYERRMEAEKQLHVQQQQQIENQKRTMQKQFQEQQYRLQQQQETILRMQQQQELEKMQNRMQSKENKQPMDQSQQSEFVDIRYQGTTTFPSKWNDNESITKHKAAGANVIWSKFAGVRDPENEIQVPGGIGSAAAWKGERTLNAYFVVPPTVVGLLNGQDQVLASVAHKKLTRQFLELSLMSKSKISDGIVPTERELQTVDKELLKHHVSAFGGEAFWLSAERDSIPERVEKEQEAKRQGKQVDEEEPAPLNSMFGFEPNAKFQSLYQKSAARQKRVKENSEKRKTRQQEKKQSASRQEVMEAVARKRELRQELAKRRRARMEQEREQEAMAQAALHALGHIHGDRMLSDKHHHVRSEKSSAHAHQRIKHQREAERRRRANELKQSTSRVASQVTHTAPRRKKKRKGKKSKRSKQSSEPRPFNWEPIATQTASDLMAKYKSLANSHPSRQPRGQGRGIHPAADEETGSEEEVFLFQNGEQENKQRIAELRALQSRLKQKKGETISTSTVPGDKPPPRSMAMDESMMGGNFAKSKFNKSMTLGVSRRARSRSEADASTRSILKNPLNSDSPPRDMRRVSLGSNGERRVSFSDIDFTMMIHNANEEIDRQQLLENEEIKKQKAEQTAPRRGSGTLLSAFNEEYPTGMKSLKGSRSSSPASSVVSKEDKTELQSLFGTIIEEEVDLEEEAASQAAKEQQEKEVGELTDMVSKCATIAPVEPFFETKYGTVIKNLESDDPEFVALDKIVNLQGELDSSKGGNGRTFTVDKVCKAYRKQDVGAYLKNGKGAKENRQLLFHSTHHQSLMTKVLYNGFGFYDSLAEEEDDYDDDAELVFHSGIQSMHERIDLNTDIKVEGEMRMIVSVVNLGNSRTTLESMEEFVSRYRHLKRNPKEMAMVIIAATRWNKMSAEEQESNENEEPSAIDTLIIDLETGVIDSVEFADDDTVVREPQSSKDEQEKSKESDTDKFIISSSSGWRGFIGSDSPPPEQHSLKTADFNSSLSYFVKDWKRCVAGFLVQVTVV